VPYRDGEAPLLATDFSSGVYLPGVGGIRIEDLVILRDDGPEVVSPFTKELVEVS